MEKIAHQHLYEKKREGHWDALASKETIMKHKALLEVCSGCSDLKRATVLARSTIALWRSYFDL